jgi:hypothetical protein
MKHEMPQTMPGPGSGRREKVVSETRPNPFPLDKIIHPLLVKYPTSYLAQGGEHLVFDVGKRKVPEQMRDVVVKANIHYARMLQELGAEYSENTEELPNFVRDDMEDSIKLDREKYERFRSYFGANNVSPQRKFLMRVPVSKDIGRVVFPDMDMPPEEAWTVVTVQKRAKELGPEYATRRHDIGTTYAERKPRVTPEAYAETSARLFSGEPKGKRRENGVETMEEIVPRNARLLSLAEREPGLKAQVIDFVRKAIKYSQDTGEIVDMIGRNNIAFVYDTKPDGSRVWRYKITDGFCAHPSDMGIRNAEYAVSDLVDEGKTTEERLVCFMNVANYVRAINAMAEQLGIRERLRVFTGLPKDTYKKMIIEVRRVMGVKEEKRAA